MQASISPEEWSSLSRKAESLIAAGRPAAARPLLAALRRADPHDAACAILEARLLVREGHLPQAIAALDGAVARHADDVALLLTRCELLLEAGEVTRAAGDAASAVIADRGNAKAKATLGIVLLQMGRVDEALRCITEAVGDAPYHPGLHVVLAEGQERSGDPEGAARTLDAAIARWPGEVSLRAAAMMTALRQRAFQRVVGLGEAARRDGLADATVFGLLGHARATLGAHDLATEAYLEAQKLAPEDPQVRHMVAASRARQAGDATPAELVETLFDDFADRFEDHLIGLSYRIPGLIRRALLRHATRQDDLGDVLDLGCGTGFMGVALSDLPIRRLAGVDVSGRMLAHARAKDIYADLHHRDIAHFLREHGQGWDVVIAADVLTYFGPLDDIFAALRPRLRRGGLLLFSLETLLSDMGGAGGEGWRAYRQGRFVHLEAYIRAALADAGFVVRSVENESLRLEGGMPVQGLIVTATVASPQ